MGIKLSQYRLSRGESGVGLAVIRLFTRQLFRAAKRLIVEPAEVPEKIMGRRGLEVD